LDLLTNATQGDIKKAYYVKAQKCHPNNNTGNLTTPAKMEQQQVYFDDERPTQCNRSKKNAFDNYWTRTIWSNANDKSSVPSIFENELPRLRRTIWRKQHFLALLQAEAADICKSSFGHVFCTTIDPTLELEATEFLGFAKNVWLGSWDAHAAVFSKKSNSFPTIGRLRRRDFRLSVREPKLSWHWRAS
jgi:hypothetical protein